MQISTNLSVSHLRHWRPPVVSTGQYLYRYTGRSWFKSKQNALRSILPNANIHHNEKCPTRGQQQTHSVSASHPEEDEDGSEPPPPPAGLYEAVHTKQEPWRCCTWIYNIKVWGDDPCEVNRTSDKEQRTADCEDRPMYLCMRTGENGVPVKFRNRGFFFSGEESRGVGGCSRGHNWDNFNGKLAAKQHDALPT